MEKKEKFDPFKDRQARLVRNRLSGAFVEALTLKDPQPVDNEAAVLLRQYDHALYRGYVKERTRRYRLVHAALKSAPRLGEDVFLLASLLWDQGLYFEVHELLEGHWGKAAGGRRRALQGLIQAAGSYLLLAAGNEKGATRLADKAAANLEGNRQQLPKAMRVEELIAALKNRATEAPPLL